MFTLKFLKELPLYDATKPYKLHGFPELSNELQSNCVFQEFGDVLVEDVRDATDKCRIEDDGFEFVRAPTRSALSPQVFEQDTVDGNDVVQDYVEETMGLVRERFNADYVITIDWRVTCHLAALGSSLT